VEINETFQSTKESSKFKAENKNKDIREAEKVQGKKKKKRLDAIHFKKPSPRPLSC
jgi:hypothetical protein